MKIFIHLKISFIDTRGIFSDNSDFVLFQVYNLHEICALDDSWEGLVYCREWLNLNILRNPKWNYGTEILHLDMAILCQIVLLSIAQEWALCLHHSHNYHHLWVQLVTSRLSKFSTNSINQIANTLKEQLVRLNRIGVSIRHKTLDKNP